LGYYNDAVLCCSYGDLKEFLGFLNPLLYNVLEKQFLFTVPPYCVMGGFV